MHASEIWSIILQYIDINNQQSILWVCSASFEASLNSDFWNFFQFTEKKISKFLNQFLEFLIQLENIPKSYLVIIKKLIKDFPLYLYSSNRKILQLCSRKDANVIFNFLNSIDYPLDKLIFCTQDQVTERFLGSKNRFTLLHYIVWLENIELTKYVIENKILKQEMDSLGLYPFIYSCFLGNLELANLLQIEMKKLQKLPNVDYVLNRSYYKNSNIRKLLKNLGFHSFKIENQDYEEIDKKELIEYDEKRNKDIQIQLNKERIYEFGTLNLFNHLDIESFIESSDDDENENGLSLQSILEKPENIIKFVIEEFEETYEALTFDGCLENNLFPFTKRRRLSKDYIEIPLKKRKYVRDTNEEIQEETEKIQINDIIIDKRNFIIEKEIFRNEDLNVKPVNLEFLDKLYTKYEYEILKKRYKK